MIAELGLALLWMAAALACLSLVAGTLFLRGGSKDLAALVRPASVAQGVLTTAAFGLLIALFVRSDMSVELVARNSNSLKPMIFKVAGTWGNHEGSMLLWLMILSFSGGLIAIFERRLREDTLVATLAAQAALSLGFFAFLLFSSNPFKRLPVAPPDGQGLNPLLQDIGLAFHPPTLYVGYVGLSVAFSFAVGALITREIGPAFARAMRPWVLGSWIFLTLGITAGSYWAYYELGWGGWWFWDPVENVSLIPWLAGAALLHSVAVTATRNALRAWTVMLAVIGFSMSMVGTFIVRSGLLTSVHSFAVDPERGTFLLALMAIDIGGALTLFALRAGSVAEGKKFALLSREGSLVMNNLLLTTILALVLLGTLYPIVAEAMGEKISVGPPYYNRVAGPLALALCLVMVAGPLLSWRKDDGKRLWSRLPLAIFAGAAVLFALILFGGKVGILPLLGMTVAGIVAVASLAPLWGRNLRRTPLPTWGMVIAHFGVAVCLAGMGAESAFIKERLVAAAPGDVVKVGDFSVKFVGVKPVAGPNYTAIEGTLVATTSSGSSFTMRPEARTFPGLMGTAPTETNEAALLTRPGGQLYAVLGQPVTGDDGRADRYQIRLWWKPLVWWIWLGGGLIALGAALSLLGRAQLLTIWRARRARKAEERFGVKNRWVLFVPLAIMGLLFGAFVYRLVTPAETLIQSQWIDKPMPLFDLPPATAGVEGLKSSQLADGRPRLVNVFASWCIPCRAEAPQLEALKAAGVPIDGIAIRDRPEDVAMFLREYGNPFDRVGADMQSSVQIALGSSGVPETFLIDGKGIIREQIQGVILADQVPEIVAKLEAMK